MTTAVTEGMFVFVGEEDDELEGEDNTEAYSSYGKWRASKLDGMVCEYPLLLLLGLIAFMQKLPELAIFIQKSGKAFSAGSRPYLASADSSLAWLSVLIQVLLPPLGAFSKPPFSHVCT